MSEDQDLVLIDLEPALPNSDVSFGLEASSLAEKSAEIMDKAMGTIRGMATKVVKTVKSIDVHERPSKVEVEFGIKLDADAGALVARAGTEAAITVTLTWEHSTKTQPWPSQVKTLE